MSGARKALGAFALAMPVVLAALHPLVFVLRSASASHRFACEVIMRPAAVMAAAALLVFLALRAVMGSTPRASVAGTFFFVVAGLFPFLAPEQGFYGWWFTAAFALGSLAVAVAFARLLDGIAGILVVCVLGIVVIWAATTTYATIAAWPRPDWWPDVQRLSRRASSVPLPANHETPDIYYIVLDGMARADVLEAMYGVDSRRAVAALEELGFRIPPRSRSNYAQTQLSLASSLNMAYLEDLASVMADRFDKRPLIRLITQAGAVAALTEQGYHLEVVQSGTGVGMKRDTTLDFSDLPPGPTELEHALLLRAAGAFPGLHVATLRAHRHQVLTSFDAIESAASDRPLLLVGHIVSPHPPFVIGSDGQERIGQDAFTFVDGDGFPGTRDEYIAGYRAQAEFVLGRVTRLAERIIARSPRALIVVHSDHGPGLRFVNMDATRSDPFERLANFSAYYSGGRAAPVPDTMSPVNALRWVFRYGLGADLPLLPDRSYLSDYERPYRFIDIPSERLDEEAR